jgi:hypothetical protein
MEFFNKLLDRCEAFSDVSSEVQLLGHVLNSLSLLFVPQFHFGMKSRLKP